MTADLRQQIRDAIDNQARARRQALIDGGELEVCAGCGGELDHQSTGCKHCYDRKRRRERRQSDPAYRERNRLAKRASRERQRTMMTGDSCPRVEP